MTPHLADFTEFLSKRLRVGTKVRVYHVCTPPTSAPAIFASIPGQEDEKTTCESHFLGITQKSLADAANNEVLILGIEVLVFSTAGLNTVFVSKADSTGFLARQTHSEPGESVAQVVIATFLEYLVTPRLKQGNRLVLSLFARSQNQYLFPGSIENPTKHVLDDRQLIKWWCRVLGSVTTFIQETSKVYVVVPGCDKAETKAFFPASARYDTSADSKWQNRYPVELLAQHPAAPVRCLIPRLPDDPKARFCTDLDGEHVDADGNWRSIRSLDQFWEMMSYRQECSAGRLVGFIWVVFSQFQPASQALSSPPASQHVTTDRAEAPQQESTEVNGKIGTEVITPRLTADPSEANHQITSVESTGVISRSSSITARETSSVQKEANADDENNVKSTTATVTASSTISPMAGDGHVTASADAYEELAALLLEQLDFAGIETARKSTVSWIEKVRELTGATEIGRDANGQLAAAATISPASDQQQAVNILSGVRKKRKADVSDPTDLQHEPRPVTAPISTLSAGLIKKKPKPG